MTWRDRAACKGIDPETWFPLPETPTAAERAKEICRRCPVRNECLEFALINGCHYGIWGGLTEKERDSLVRQGSRSRKVDPHQVHEVGRMTRAGLSAVEIGKRLGMVPRVVNRYRKLAREAS